MANLLIVEDDRDIVDAFADILRNKGHTVRTAHNGKQGLCKLREQPLPDAVLLDVEMPVMTGPEMAHLMLLHDAGEERIPVILISARPNLPEIAKAVGTPYFVPKPGGIEVFLEVINRALVERISPHTGEGATP